MNAPSPRWTGGAMLVAGILIAVGFALHPREEFANYTTNAWSQAHWLVSLGALLAVFGVTGLYIKWLGASGALGTAAYALLTTGFALIVGVAAFEASMVPALASNAADAETLLAMDGPIFTGSFGMVFLALLATTGLGGLLTGWTLYSGKHGPPIAAILLLIAAPLLSVAIMMEVHALVLIAGIALGAGLAWVGYAMWNSDGASAMAAA